MGKNIKFLCSLDRKFPEFFKTESVWVHVGKLDGLPDLALQALGPSPGDGELFNIIMTISRNLLLLSNSTMNIKTGYFSSIPIVC